MKRQTIMNVGGLLVGLPLGAILAVVGWGAWMLTASRAELDGELVVKGLSRSVTIERDDLGVPTITADNRNDLAYATGFLHGDLAIGAEVARSDDL